MARPSLARPHRWPGPSCLRAPLAGHGPRHAHRDAAHQCNQRNQSAKDR